MQALGVIKVGRRDRVLIDDEGITELNDYRENVNGVEMSERKETRVLWSEVLCIALAENYAIFTLTAKGHLFVPAKAFQDREKFFQFVEQASKLHRAYLRRQTTGITLGPPDTAVKGL